MDGSTEKKSIGTLIKRIVAIVLLGIYLVLLGTFIYMLFSGSTYVVQMLFVFIIYPIILYLFIWIRKVFDKKEEE